MATYSQNQAANPSRAFKTRTLLIKIAGFVVAGLVLGHVYDWAAPRLYGPERTFGLGLGMVHGALMPAALPSLLMGKDVPIYATSATARIYKIGYIAGINLCGLFFFGIAFWSPKRPPNQTAGASPPTQ